MKPDWFTPRYPPATRVTLRNQSDKELHVCVYDNVCKHIARTAQIFSRSKILIMICVDENRRGSILVFDKSGNHLRYDDIRDDRIDLPVHDD